MSNERTPDGDEQLRTQRKGFFDGFDPDHPNNLIPRSRYDDHSAGMSLGRAARQMFLVRWPDDSVALMSAPSRHALLMMLDEVADPGMALVKPYDGPIYMEIEPRCKIAQHCTLQEIRLTRGAKPPLMNRRLPSVPSVKGVSNLFESGRFTDFDVVVQNDEGSRRIACHKAVIQNLRFVKDFLSEQPGATEIEMSGEPPLCFGIVHLALQFHYGAKLSWESVRPSDLTNTQTLEEEDDDPSDLEAHFAAIESDIEKWIHQLVVVQQGAVELGVFGLVEAAANQMRIRVDRFVLHKTRHRGRLSEDLKQRLARQAERTERRIPFGCRSLWRLAMVVDAATSVKKLAGLMRGSVKSVLSEEADFIRVIGSDEPDLMLYRKTQVRKYSASFNFDPSSYNAKLLSVEQGPPMVDKIEAMLYPHRFYVKTMHQRSEFGYGADEDEVQDWNALMREAIKRDEDYLESKTKYHEKQRRIEGSDDFMSRLMRDANISSPEVMAGMIDPSLLAMMQLMMGRGML